jgi:hypothetical protein
MLCKGSLLPAPGTDAVEINVETRYFKAVALIRKQNWIERYMYVFY